MLSIFRKTIFLLYLFLQLALNSGAQGWEQQVGGISFDNLLSVEQAQDGNYILAGTSASYSFWGLDGYLAKINPAGDTLWTKVYGREFQDEAISKVKATKDGGFIFTGMTNHFLGNPTLKGELWLVKVNAAGHVEWEHTFTNDPNIQLQGSSVIEADNGDFVVTGMQNLFNLEESSSDLVVLRTSALGDLKWMKVYDWAHADVATSMIELPNCSLIITGFLADAAFTQSDTYLLKLTAYGDVIFLVDDYDNFNVNDGALNMIKTNDGQLLLVGQGGSAVAMLKVAPDDGAPIWLQLLLAPDAGDQRAYGVREAANGDFILVGDTKKAGATTNDLFLAKTDAFGNEIWRKTFGGINDDVGRGLLETADGGVLAVGNTASFGLGSADIYLVKTDASGNSNTHYYQGQVFFDQNNSCDFQAGEIPLPNWVVRAENQAGDIQYGITDSLGIFTIKVATDDYSLSLLVKNEYWDLGCPQISNATTSNTSHVDFPVWKDENIEGPYMTVDVSAVVISPGETSTYTLRYANEGTLPAVNVEIEVALDEALAYIGTNHPNVAAISSDSLLVRIGDMPVGTYGSLELYLELDANADVGLTHCVSTHILPDDIYYYTPWDGNQIQTSSECLGDSIKFTLKVDNTVPETTNYLVIENDFILRMGSLDFSVQSEYSFTEATNGNTIRLIVPEQLASYPGRSMPTVAVETCTTLPSPSIGFYNDFPEDDAEPFLSSHCLESRASLDFAKTTTANSLGMDAFPNGFCTPNYIQDSTDIEYFIYFKNDTISNLHQLIFECELPTERLDITSIQYGTRSHSYKAFVKNSDTLVFVLDSAALVDKPIQGDTTAFVKFRISQQAGTVGATITTRASVFVNNKQTAENPIPLSYTHTVIDSLQNALPGCDTIPKSPQEKFTPLIVTPSISSDKIDISYTLKEIQSTQLRLLNSRGELRYEKVTGQAVGEQFQSLDIRQLPPGIYYCTLRIGGELTTRKFVIAR